MGLGLEKNRRRVKETRDKGFEAKNTKGQVVNRITNIASVGSAAMDNEECWTYQALMRSWGLSMWNIRPVSDIAQQ